MSVLDAARRLVEQRPQHRVVSLYLDLDPERFATAPARASQIRSLIDTAARDAEADDSLEHEDRIALREDLERVKRYLLSREPPFKGARALAVFCSGRDGLFEVVQVSHPVQALVAVERTPYVAPLLAGAVGERWCAALVSRREARIFTGPPDGLRERERIEANVHGQHDQGGFSQANYQRSVEQEAENHLRRVADALGRRWRRERLQRLALGGPHEVVARFEGFLHDDLRALVSPGRIDVDVGAGSQDQVRAALAGLVEESAREREREALDQLSAGLASGRRAAGGPQDTLDALGQRRVQTLLLEEGGRFNRPGGRCRTCGLLSLETHGQCPADGTELEEVEHLREAVVESALMQDAEIVIVRHNPDLGPFEGIGALLRF
jgi:peptide chain release factor subunit 1